MTISPETIGHLLLASGIGAVAWLVQRVASRIDELGERIGDHGEKLATLAAQTTANERRMDRVESHGMNGHGGVS